MRIITQICDSWKFKKIKEIPELYPEDWEDVLLPHTWNAIDGQDGGDDYWRGKGVYVRKLKKSELPVSDQHYLEIEGSNSSASVYLNGILLGSHDGGYSLWRVDLTDALKEENLLVITCDNSPDDEVYPQMADFTFYGGLYRKVNVISVPHEHFELIEDGMPGISITALTDPAHRTAHVTVSVKHNAEYAYITVEGKTEKVRETAEFDLNNVHLWNGTKDPYLYTAKAQLESGDEVSARFGCRQFRIDAEEGFFLNGCSYPLHGVSRHQDREGIGSALSAEHHLEDIDLICEMGANAVRLAHYQHDQYFYDLCDERGLVVWTEIPYISKHTESGCSNTVSQMRELIIQNYNHPSIAVWGISNEVTIGGPLNKDMLVNHRLLNDLVHHLDPYRLSTMAVLGETDITSEYTHIPDCVGVNTYLGWYKGSAGENGPLLDQMHKAAPEIPLCISEYGCEALDYHNPQPSAGDYSEEYQMLFHEQLISQIKSRKYLWGTFVWNMFDFGSDRRDEGGCKGRNNKGLITFDRKRKKDAFYVYKAWLSEKPFVHICSKRYVKRTENPAEVKICSNMKSVELIVNGISAGTQYSDSGVFRFTIANEGESRLCAKAGECIDEAIIIHAYSPDPLYSFEKTAVHNWFETGNDLSCYSLNCRIEELLACEEAASVLCGTLAEMMKNNPRIPAEPAAASAVIAGMLKQWGGMKALNVLESFIKNGLPITHEDINTLNRKLEKIRKG